MIVVKAMEKQAEEERKQAALLFKMVKRFAELSDPEVVQKVKDETEFDWIVKDL